jgi:thymidylate synthase (FAD)
LKSELKVKLLKYTPDPEEIVASAAKLCYSKVGVEELMSKMTQDKVDEFVEKLSDLHHESPFEHVSFTFAIEGVSRALTHQLVRHRVASYSQQSQRYVALEQFEYIIPPSIKPGTVEYEIFKKAMEADQKAYNDIFVALRHKHILKLLNAIDPEYAADYKDKSYLDSNTIPLNILKNVNNKAEKMAAEDARYVFPNACESKIVVTMNARTLFNFFAHRCCERAQWEIRELAFQMLKIVKDIAPSIFRHSGANCVTLGYCSENRMQCDKFKNKIPTLENVNIMIKDWKQAL